MKRKNKKEKKLLKEIRQYDSIESVLYCASGDKRTDSRWKRMTQGTGCKDGQAENVIRALGGIYSKMFYYYIGERFYDKLQVLKNRAKHAKRVRWGAYIDNSKILFRDLDPEQQEQLKQMKKENTDAYGISRNRWWDKEGRPRFPSQKEAEEMDCFSDNVWNSVASKDEDNVECADVLRYKNLANSWLAKIFPADKKREYMMWRASADISRAERIQVQDALTPFNHGLQKESQKKTFLSQQTVSKVIQEEVKKFLMEERPSWRTSEDHEEVLGDEAIDTARLSKPTLSPYLKKKREKIKKNEN